MPRPRFQKLSSEQRRAILDVAVEEFSEHGFKAASINRIIERAGISKGSMYYYFDDKADVYLAVLDEAVQELKAAVFPCPLDVTSLKGAEFWTEMRALYVRAVKFFKKSSRASQLAHGYAHAMSDPALEAARAGFESASVRWFSEVLSAGQRAGAVRTDLPLDLLVATTWGVAQATDLWMLPQLQSMTPKGIEKLADTVVTDLLKRLLAP